MKKMETIISAFKGTPWWVYILFAYLLYLGIQELKPRTISIGKMFILPLLLFVWGLYGLIAKFQAGEDILIWLAFIVGGFFIGTRLMKKTKIRADRKKLLIRLPGRKLTLVLVMSIFFIKYIFGYYYVTQTEVSLYIRYPDLIITGAITGIFIGRAYSLLKKIATTKHENL